MVAPASNDDIALQRLNLLSLILSVTLALAAFLIISETDTVIGLPDITKALALSGFLILAPHWFSRLFRAGASPLPEVYGTLLTFATLLLLGAASLAPLVQPVAFGLVVVLAFLAFVSFGFGFRANKAALTTTVWVAGSAVLGIWVVSIIWGSLYQSPLFFEQLVIGNAHKDTLFNSSLSSTLRIYFTPSTGLDGTPVISYHWGSHIVIGALAQLSGFHSLKFYNVAYPIVFIPLFFKAMGLFSLSIRDARGLDKSIGIAFIVTLLIGVISFFPEARLARYAIWTKHLYVSESYLVGFTAVFLFLSITIGGLRNADHKARERSLLLVGLPAMVAVLALIKVSIGALATACYGYWLARTVKFIRPAYFFSGLLTLGAFIVVYKATWGSGVETPLEPFHFLSKYVTADDAHKYRFFLFHYFWVWVCLALTFVGHRIFSIPALWVKLKSGDLLELELLLVLTVWGLIPGILMKIGAGNAFYFSDIQRWVAIALIVAYLPLVASAFSVPGKWEELSSWLREWKNAAIAICLVVILAFVSRGVYERINFRFSRLINDVSSDIKAYSDIVATDEGRERAVVRDILLELSELTDQEKRRSCLYIPKTHQVFWNTLEREGANSFVAPAVSGIKMIEGLPAYHTVGWGYDQYIFPERAVLEASTAQLLERSAIERCKNVYRITLNDTSKLDILRVSD